MNRSLAIFAAVIAAFAFTCQGADAKSRRHHIDKRLAAVSIGVGAASTAAYLRHQRLEWKLERQRHYAVRRLGRHDHRLRGGVADGGDVVLNRPLTMREAHVLIGSCVIPIVGGWLVNEAYDAHPEWEAGTVPVGSITESARQEVVAASRRIRFQ